jgi:hypothetical protein
MRPWGKRLAWAALGVGALVALYELTWVRRSGIAWALAGVGASVVLVALAVILGSRTEEHGEGWPGLRRLPRQALLLLAGLRKLSRRAMLVLAGVSVMLLSAGFLVGAVLRRPPRSSYQEVQGPERVVSGVRFFDMILDSNQTLRGRMANRGDSLVTLASLRVTLYGERDESLDGADFLPAVRTPPPPLFVRAGDVQSFEFTVPVGYHQMRFPAGKWHWDYAPLVRGIEVAELFRMVDGGAGRAPQAAPGARPMTPQELAKVEGTVAVDLFGRIVAKLYNGNERPISDLVINVDVRDMSGGLVLDRWYSLEGDCKALASDNYLVKAGFTLEEGQGLRWSLVSGVIH